MLSRFSFILVRLNFLVHERKKPLGWGVKSLPARCLVAQTQLTAMFVPLFEHAYALILATVPPSVFSTVIISYYLLWPWWLDFGRDGIWHPIHLETNGALQKILLVWPLWTWGMETFSICKLIAVHTYCTSLQSHIFCVENWCLITPLVFRSTHHWFDMGTNTLTFSTHL